MKIKTVVVVFTLLLLASLAYAQPSQEMPHRLFGTLEDSQGEPVADTEVEIVFDGETVVLDTTDSDGYYDLQIPYSEDYASEELDIEADGRQTATVTFNSGEVEEKDLELPPQQNNQQQTQETSSGGGGGGGGGGGLSTENNQQTSSDNTQEETSNDGSSDTSDDTSDDGSETNSQDTDSDDSSDTDQDDSQSSGNAITGLFTSASSDLGSLFTGIIESITGVFASLF